MNTILIFQIIKHISVQFITSLQQKVNHDLTAANCRKKAFDKIQYPFSTKKNLQLGLEGNFLNLMQCICGKKLQLAKML